MPLCGRSKDPTRVRSPRQLPTDHDYAARPANIRLINRRDSFLDRYPRRLRYRKKEKPALVVDWSFHIRGAGSIAQRLHSNRRARLRVRPCCFFLFDSALVFLLRCHPERS